MHGTRISLMLVTLVVTHADFTFFPHEVDFSAFSGRVVACPGNSTSLTAGGSCECVAGYFSDAGTCVPCASGTYSDTVSDAACLPCPASSHSLPGSTSVKECLCGPGHEQNSGSCQACQHGEYKSFYSSSSMCFACHANSNTVNAGSTSHAACLCDPGHARAGMVCELCAQNTFKSERSDQACTDCAVNFYATGTGNTRCTPCFADSSRAVGDVECRCNAGFQKNATHNGCEICPGGSFCTGEDAVTSCVEAIGAHSSSHAGAVQASDCFCLAGFYLNGAVCTKCSVDTYCPEASTSETECPKNSHAPVQSVSEDACVCDPGYRV